MLAAVLDMAGVSHHTPKQETENTSGFMPAAMPDMADVEKQKQTEPKPIQKVLISKVCWQPCWTSKM
jgi:hypothetical protein